MPEPGKDTTKQWLIFQLVGAMVPNRHNYVCSNLNKDTITKTLQLNMKSNSSTLKSLKYPQINSSYFVNPDKVNKIINHLCGMDFDDLHALYILMSKKMKEQELEEDMKEAFKAFFETDRKTGSFGKKDL